MFSYIMMDTIRDDKRPGRAAQTNLASRFNAVTAHRIDDGWGRDVTEDDTVLRTQLRAETARSLITYNRSPDLPFDRSINVYRGCEHGCIYCFARPSHAYLGLSPGLDFETRLIMRPNAPEVLAREISSRKYRVAPIAIGTNTDPYQPVEAQQRLTRACLEVLAAARHPIAIVTKGALIERDIDILAPMAQQGLVRVGISVTTLDADLSRKLEPRAPNPVRRFKTIERLAKAGIDVRVMASPMIPALTDPELERILEAGALAGARQASWIMLRLPREVSPLWQEWLDQHAPNRKSRIMGHLRQMHGGKDYDARWGHRMRGAGPYADMVSQRFKVAVKRFGLTEHGTPLRCDLFLPPDGRGVQMSFL